MKNPFLLFSAFGIGLGLTDWTLEHFRGGHGKRSLQEHGLIAFNAVGLASYTRTRSFGASFQPALFAALLYPLVRWWYVWGEPTLQWRRKEQMNAMRIPIYENPPPMPQYHKERWIHGVFSEDYVGKYSAEKLGAFNGPDYREE